MMLHTTVRRDDRPLTKACRRPSWRGLLLAFVAVFAVGISSADAEAAKKPQVRTIKGVVHNATVSGKLLIEARVAGKPTSVRLTLVGPDGKTTVNRTSAPYALVLTNSGRTGAWDSDAHPEGKYILTVRAYRGEKMLHRKRIRFLVNHDGPSSATDTRILRSTNKEIVLNTEPPKTPAEPEVSQEPTEETATTDEEVVATETNATANASSVSFLDTPAEHTLGSTTPIRFSLDASLADDMDIVAIAWSDQTKTVVDAYAHQFTNAPSELDISQLNLLPVGRYNLQLLLRKNNKVIDKADFWIDVVEQVVEETTTTDEDSDGEDVVDEYSVHFVANSPTAYTVGEAETFSVYVVGDSQLQDYDVLLLAWSTAEQRMVSEFAHTFEGSQGTILQSKLDLLPEGKNALIAILRIAGEPYIQTHQSIVVSHPVAETPDVSADETNDDPVDDTADDTTQTNDTTDDTTDDSTADDTTHNTTDDSTDTVDVTADPEPNVTVDYAIRFDVNSPTNYVVGESPTFNIYVEGNPLPEDYDVLLLAWSASTQTNVDTFTHSFDGDEGVILNDELDSLPAGDFSLVAVLRIAGKPYIQTHQNVTVLPVESETPETPEDPVVVDDDPAPSTDDAIAINDGGWTEFTPSSDTRVIYVSSSQGSDSNNTGLSPQSPLRTQKAGAKLLRNGYPDWMLLKRGDTFRGGIKGDSYWNKSGRSASEPMVIGAYGDESEPRPKFATDGESFISIYHSTTIKYIAFVDLHLYANQRDPNGAEFIDGRSKESGVRWLSPLKNVLFENMLIEYYSFGMVFQAYNNPYDQDGLTIRRCVIRNSYTPYDVGHSSGLFIKKNKNVLIEQNVLDHNGWIPGVSKSNRTKFNHNVYITHSKNAKLLDNIVTRGGSFGFKVRSDITAGFVGVTIKGNLLAENIHTITFGGNKVDGTYQPLAIQDIVIANNVFTQMGGSLSGTPQSFGVELRSTKNVLVERNIWTDKDWYGASFAMNVLGYTQENVVIQRNVVHNWDSKHIFRDDQNKATIQYNLVDIDTDRYVDAPRTMDTYVDQIGVSDLDSLLKQAAKQRKGYWRTPYTAKAIVKYFRDGFELAPFD